MFSVEFHGAAQGVTGSMHLVRTPRANILLDCGLFQGRRNESIERNRDLRVDPKNIDAVVLSHAHIDHSGSLPRLYKQGYRGPIYTTPATRDLCRAMLKDAAAIQLHDAKWINESIRRGKSDMEPVEALYDQEDVVGVLSQTTGLPYRQKLRIAEGVELTLFDAGHVLGSALVALDIDDEGLRRRLLFTGDLGRRSMPILRDPESPDGVSVLITEGTYGDRLHPPIERMEDELAEIIQETVKRGGKVVIPSFALERAQEVVYALRRLQRQGRLPNVPVYVDSPLTLGITDVFRRHPECFDKETRRHLSDGETPFDFPGLHYVTSVEESKRIDRDEGPAVIVSASGMCEFGRVVHHLKAIADDPKSTVVIVGFQAQHTLGRRLVEGRRKIRILGVMWERAFQVRTLNGFSAHADQADLIAFAEQARERGPLRHVVLVHGELRQLEALKGHLDARHFPSVAIPAEGESLTF